MPPYTSTKNMITYRMSKITPFTALEAKDIERRRLTELVTTINKRLKFSIYRRNRDADFHLDLSMLVYDMSKIILEPFAGFKV